MTTPAPTPFWDLPPLDRFGREIEPGHRVVYGVYTRGGGLRDGVVEKVVAKGDIKKGFRNKVTGAYEYYMVPNWKITVVIESERWDSTTSKYEPCEARSTLDTPGRFAIVHVDS